MTHDVADVLVEEHRFTLTCECGHTVWHRIETSAERLHATHVAIETARAALKGPK